MLKIDRLQVSPNVDHQRLERATARRDFWAILEAHHEAMYHRLDWVKFRKI